MKMSCTFEVTGKLEEKRFDDSRRGKSFWFIVVATDDGVQGLYVHDELVQEKVSDIPIGTIIRASGVIKSRRGGETKPIFLSPNELTVAPSS